MFWANIPQNEQGLQIGSRPDVIHLTLLNGILLKRGHRFVY